MNDLVNLAARQAAENFKGEGDKSDGIFNAAGFSQRLTTMAQVSGQLDGNVVRAILCGRPDIEVLPGDAHFRVKRVGP